MTVAGAVMVKVIPDARGFKTGTAAQLRGMDFTPTGRSMGQQIVDGAHAQIGSADPGKMVAPLATRLQSAGQRMRSVGTNMTLGLTAPLALLGAASVKQGATFESSLSQMANALDKPMSQMGDLKRVAFDTGDATVFSAQEAADAMTELAKGGFSEAQIKAGALKATTDLAAAGQLQLADSAGLVTAAMNAFNIEAKDAPRIADALAGAADSSSANVDDLAQALTQVSSVADGAGQSLQSTTGFLAAMADEGIKGSDAGTSLKTMLMRIQSPTGQAADVMERYGLSFRKANGEMKSLPAIAGQLSTKLRGLTSKQRDAAFATLFGADAVRAARVAYKNGEDGIRKYENAASKQGAASKAAASKMGGTQRALEELSGAWENLLITFGTDETVVSAVQGIAGALKDATKWFSGLEPAGKKAVIGIGLFIAAAGPAIAIAGSLAGAVGKILALKNFGTITKGLKGITGAAEGLCAGSKAKMGGFLGDLDGVGRKAKGATPAVTGIAGAADDVAVKSSRASKLVSGLGIAARGALRLTGPVGIVVGVVEFIGAVQEAERNAKTSEAAITRMKAAMNKPLKQQTGYNRLQHGQDLGNAIALGQYDQYYAKAARSQDALTRASANFTRTLQAGNGIITQRNNGTLRGVQLTQQAKGALQGQATAARNYLQSMVDAGKPAADIARTARSNAQAFQRQAVAMGFNKKQASLLARSYDVIPKQVRTQIRAIGAEEVKQKTQQIDQRLKELRAKRTAIKVNSSDPDVARRKIDNVNKKIKDLNGQKARIKAEAEGVNEALAKLQRLPKALRGKDEVTIKAVAETAKADTSINKTKSLLKELDGEQANPKIEVQDNAAEVSAQVQSQMASIPDTSSNHTIYIREERIGGGGGGTGGGGGGFRWFPAGGDSTAGSGLLRTGGAQSLGARISSPVGIWGPQAPTFGQNLGKEYEQYLKSVFNALELLKTRGSAKTRDALEAIVRAEWAGQQQLEDQRDQFTKAQEDAATAYSRAVVRPQQAKINTLSRAVQRRTQIDDSNRRIARLRDRVSSTSGDKQRQAQRDLDNELQSRTTMLDNQKRALRELNVGGARKERKLSAFGGQKYTAASLRKELNKRQDSLDDKQTKYSRVQNDQGKQYNRVLEERTRQQQELVRLAEEALAKAEEEKAAQQQAAAERKQGIESITQSLVSQATSLRDRLRDSVDWNATTNPATLLRNLRKRRTLLAQYNADISQLQAAGLSADAMQALSQMDPTQAAKLTKRLLADPSLVASINAEYAGLIDQSTQIGAKQTAGFAGLGSNVIDGLIAGINGNSSSLMATIDQLGDAMVAGLKAKLGIASPSREFATLGRFTAQGLEVGITSQRGAVQAALTDLVRSPRLDQLTLPVAGARGGDGASLQITQNIHADASWNARQIADATVKEMTWQMGSLP